MGQRPNFEKVQDDEFCEYVSSLHNTKETKIIIPSPLDKEDDDGQEPANSVKTANIDYNFS